MLPPSATFSAWAAQGATRLARWSTSWPRAKKKSPTRRACRSGSSKVHQPTVSAVACSSPCCHTPKGRDICIDLYGKAGLDRAAGPLDAARFQCRMLHFWQFIGICSTLARYRAQQCLRAFCSTLGVTSNCSCL